MTKLTDSDEAMKMFGVDVIEAFLRLRIWDTHM